MLLVEQGLAKLREDNFFSRQAGFLDKKTFLKFKGNFTGKMHVRNHQKDADTQYFQKEAFDEVVKVQNGVEIEHIAFVFLSKKKEDGQDPNKQERLSVAMLGLDNKGKFIFRDGKAFISERKKESSNPETIDFKEFERRSKLYQEREEKEDESDFYPCRDQGIKHEVAKVRAFIDNFGERIKHAQVHIGIQDTNELQNVMLVISENNKIFDDENYAFDRGSGCCPGQ